jgi:SPP1 gp7 family putative phage head morphogenesis protein
MSTPESLYRNAIDLNRYSNSVARRVINAYNDIILDAVNQLRAIDDFDESFKAARLRSIIAQLKESLATWAGDSTELTALELQGLAELQSEFVEEQLKKVLPRGSRNIVRSVEISPQFAQSVVVTDPTQINVVALSDDLFAAVQGAPQTFSLTATQGTAITLPNGQVVSKAFRGLAESQAEMFSQIVRQGLLTGEPTQDIARRLVGRLDFADIGPLSRGQARAAGLSVKELQRAGGELTRIANNQVVALVRTSINQVANAASQQVYEANQDITKKYRYVATLDSRTSAICRALDGREFEYGKGPEPPQHFNCRSTTVAVIDYEGLGFTPPAEGKRAAQGGMIPADQSYGQWLAKQSKATKAEALGKSKVAYFDKLSSKYGPKDAIAKLVRDDGSEVTLEQLRKRYGAIKTR